MKILRSRQGHTLVELLAVIAITGIIITAAYTFLFANQSAYFSVMSQIDAQTNARNALNHVMTNIRRAHQHNLSTIQNANELTLYIPNASGVWERFDYTVEKNNATDLYELILTRGETRFVVATNLSGEEGFVVQNPTGDKITVKIIVQAKRQRHTVNLEVENYHMIKVDL